MVLTRLGHRIAAGAALLAAAVVSAVLWWRVDLASPNSAGDLWIWLVGGLLVGVSAIVTARHRQPSSPQLPWTDAEGDATGSVRPRR